MPVSKKEWGNSSASLHFVQNDIRWSVTWSLLKRNADDTDQAD